MKEKIVIVGTSSSAIEAYEFIKMYNLYEVIGFAVDEKYIKSKTFYELPVFALEKLDEAIDKNEVKLFIALLWNRLNADRRGLYERLKMQGYSFVNLISPTAIIRGKLKGDNCWIHDYVIVQPNAEIAENCMIMSYSLIGASAKVGAHCFTGAKSTVAGGSIVGEQSFVGINCTIFDDTKIGQKCILGACSVVKRNVPDFSVVKTDVNNMIIREIGEENIESKLLFKENVR